MRTNLTKVLGISLLAIVGVLAVNASAAHATWTLLRNGSSVSLLNLTAELLEGELLVKELLTIKCTGGSATAHLTGGATLNVIAHALFTGCSVLDFPDCEVSSHGTAVGTILASGSGTGSLSLGGAAVTALVSSTAGTPFASILIDHELCPFDGTLEPIFGGATLELLTPATSSMGHLAHLNDDGLRFGEREAFIDGLTLSPTTPTDTALAHVTAALGGTWAIDHS